MEGECSMCEGEDKFAQGFGGEIGSQEAPWQVSG